MSSRVRMIARRVAAGAGAIGVAAALVASAAGPAQAAVPDKWGFAYVDQPSVASTPTLSHQAGSWPAPLHAHSAPAGGGRVAVTFPRIASKDGVVHVTAVNGGAVWCQAVSWGPSGPNEVVVVRCHKAGGAVVFSPFTVLYTTSSKGPFPAGSAYAYVHWQPGPGIVAQFNSTGNPNTVTPAGLGVWIVRLLGIASSVQRGNVQVTAVNPSVPAKCEIQKWTWTGNGQTFQVNCYGVGTAALNTGWTLSYDHVRAITGTQPKFYGYTFNNMPLSPAPYVPVPPGVNFNSQGGVNRIAPAGTGLSLVTFPRVGVVPNTVLVTPFGAGPGFCNLITVWGSTPGPSGAVIVRDVACFTAGGVNKKFASLITYTSSH